MLIDVQMKYIPGESDEAHRRRGIRFGRRLTARWQADGPGTPRREALERADWAEANGLVAEAAVQRQIAEDLIPEHLKWAFYDEE